MSDSCTVTPPPAVDKSTQENDLLVGGRLVFSVGLQNCEGIDFVYLWVLTVYVLPGLLQLFFSILDSFFTALWEEVSLCSPSNFVGVIEITYFSQGKLGILQYCLCPARCAQLSEFLTSADLETHWASSEWLFRSSSFMCLQFSWLIPQRHQRSQMWCLRHHVNLLCSSKWKVLVHTKCSRQSSMVSVCLLILL